MKTIKFWAFALMILAVAACKDDSVDLLDVESEMVSNLHAPQTTDYSTGAPITTGDFVKFSFAKGTLTDGDDWDIALRGTTILVNGGASTGIAEEPARTGNAAVYIDDNTLVGVSSVDETKLTQDSASGLAITTGSGNGWYNYDPIQMAIFPITGKVLVLRTHDGRYAKVEILSYYKDTPATITEDIALNDARYYTFNYVYQPNEGVRIF